MDFVWAFGGSLARQGPVLVVELVILVLALVFWAGRPRRSMLLVPGMLVLLLVRLASSVSVAFFRTSDLDPDVEFWADQGAACCLGLVELLGLGLVVAAMFAGERPARRRGD
jgi:hypothetical protein